MSRDSDAEGADMEEVASLGLASTSNYKVRGELDDTTGIGVLGRNTATTTIDSPDTPVGVLGLAPNAESGYGLATPHDAEIGGILYSGVALEVNAGGGRVATIAGPNSSGEAGSVALGEALAAGKGSVVGGGGYDDGTTEEPNQAWGTLSTVSGGRNNRITGFGADYSTIGGGQDNTVGPDTVLDVTASWTTIGGGRGNTATSGSNYGVIAGGEDNTVEGCEWATVGGGQDNTVTGSNYGVVAGGTSNAVTAYAGTVGGGQDNTVTGSNYGVVAGGTSNAVTAYAGTVGGGRGNGVSGRAATVGGGQANDATGKNSTVAGGLSNDAAGKTGGTGTDAFQTVAGGANNKVTAYAGTVGGGKDNMADGSYATVPGGDRNRAQSDYAFAAGRRAKAKHPGTFVWSDSADADFASTARDQFLVDAPGGVGVGTNSPGSALDVAGTVSISETGAQVGLGSTEQRVQPNSATTVEFSNALVDPRNEYDTSAYKFSPDIGGNYQVNVQLTWEDAGNFQLTENKQIEIKIMKNGSRIGANQAITGSENFFSTSITKTVMNLDPSDTLSVRVIHDYGNDLDILPDNDQTYAEYIRVG